MEQWKRIKKGRTMEWRHPRIYEPNGELASEPVDRVAPYLNKYEAVISNSMVEFAP